MTKSRLESFSDGVLAIIITIMVLELKVPHEATFSALLKLTPQFMSYLLSFIFLGIYWGNHHHLLHTAIVVNSRIIWSNMSLLFFLSLIPFTTAWMGETEFTDITLAAYGVNLLLCAISFYVLQKTIMSHHPDENKLRDALKKQERKGILSLVLYAMSIPCAFILPILSAGLFVIVTIMWIIPDKNIEEALK